MGLAEVVGEGGGDGGDGGGGGGCENFIIVRERVL